jgi:hypothetical protein
MAQFLQYYGNAVNVQVTVDAAGGEIELMDGGNPAVLTGMTGLSLGINRRAITGRSDWSDYPQIIDVEHEPFDWSITHRNLERARLWFARYYLKTLQFKLHGPCGDQDVYDRLWLRGCLVEDGDWEFQWGDEVSEMTLRGTAIQARVGDKDSTWETALSLEGNLVMARDLRTPNYETAADTVHRFDTTGLKIGPPHKP